jgi:hypothetical protein
MIGMGVAIAIYYGAWIRYFAGGRSARLLRAHFLGLREPLAVAPVAFMILSSYPLASWLMFGAAVCFGIAHLRVSAATR